MLFRAKHVPIILAGEKTETRRLRSRVKVGSLHKCYSGGLPISPCPHCKGRGQVSEPSQGWQIDCPVCHGTGRLQPFATIRILRVWQERLGSISEQSALAEGYPGVGAYLCAFMDINKIANDDVNETLERQVYAIKFELVARTKEKLMTQRLSDEQRVKIVERWTPGRGIVWVGTPRLAIPKALIDIKALLEHAKWANEWIRELERALNNILDVHSTPGCTACPCGVCKTARAALCSESSQ